MLLKEDFPEKYMQIFGFTFWGLQNSAKMEMTKPQVQTTGMAVFWNKKKHTRNKDTEYVENFQQLSVREWMQNLWLVVLRLVTSLFQKYADFKIKQKSYWFSKG